jgi:transposase
MGAITAPALWWTHCHPIVYALQKYDFLVLFPINPSTLAKYREAFTPSRAKDDPTDAELALDLLLCHPDRFQPLAPQSVELRALATLVEQRRGLVNDRVRITNRLRNTLKQYYPQALGPLALAMSDILTPAGAGLQVDPHPVSVLAGPDPLR